MPQDAGNESLKASAVLALKNTPCFSFHLFGEGLTKSPPCMPPRKNILLLQRNGSRYASASLRLRHTQGLVFERDGTSLLFLSA